MVKMDTPDRRRNFSRSPNSRPPSTRGVVLMMYMYPHTAANSASTMRLQGFMSITRAVVPTAKIA